MKKAHINKEQSRGKNYVFFQLLSLFDEDYIPADVCTTQNVVKWQLFFF